MKLQTRSGDFKKKVSTLSVIGCLFSTQTGHTNMNLGFSEPDIRDELQFGNNTPYQLSFGTFFGEGD